MSNGWKPSTSRTPDKTAKIISFFLFIAIDMLAQQFHRAIAQQRKKQQKVQAVILLYLHAVVHSQSPLLRFDPVTGTLNPCNHFVMNRGKSVGMSFCALELLYYCSIALLHYFIKGFLTLKKYMSYAFYSIESYIDSI